MEESNQQDTTRVSYPQGGFYNITCNITSTVTFYSEIISRSIEIYYPISGLEINYENVVVGPNGVVDFTLQAAQGYPIFINVDYGDEIERRYEALTGMVEFSHTYQINGNYSVTFELTSPGSDIIERGHIQVVKPVPDFEFYGVNFSRIPTSIINKFLLKWSDDQLVTVENYGTIR